MIRLDLNQTNKRRTYIRTLMFILQKTVSELYPNKVLHLDYSLPSGLYGEIEGVTLTPEKIAAIKARMFEIVAADMPIDDESVPITEAIKAFEKNQQKEKALITRTSWVPFVKVYELGGWVDTFYGLTFPSTGEVKVFDLIPYLDGMCLVFPSIKDPNSLTPITAQDKLARVFAQHSHWCKVLGVNGLGSLNTALMQGRGKELIQLSEALDEHSYTEITNEIANRSEKVRLILIAGPSSSGKTTTSKRISLHLKVNGINPVVLELDNYFVSRDRTPRDEHGDYDFESLYALDIDFLNLQLEQLFAGEEVEVPRYDFISGQRIFEGKKLKLSDNDVLVMEGIHALNPELTKNIPASQKFRIYASALTSLSIDENNNISTSDNRLLRRMVRDNQYRGISPEGTIMRWSSVRAGEMKNIFPFQEEADAMFNSALIYELPLLKTFAEPLLRGVSPTSPAYPETVRLLMFLHHIIPLTPTEINAIPPTSIVREFIGGSSFSY